MQSVLDEIAEACRQKAADGKVASYIPALARVDPGKFALVVRTADGRFIGRVDCTRV